MIDITKEHINTVFCYDIARNEKFEFENLDFCCVWILDNIINKEYFRTKNKKDFTQNIACNIKDYFFKKILHPWEIMPGCSYTIERNRYLFFDANDRIFPKSFLVDKCIEIYNTNVKQIREEFRKTKRKNWLWKSDLYEKRWNDRQSRLNNKYKFISYYRKVKTLQERRLACSEEHKPFVRSARNETNLPNSWDDINVFLQYNWKEQTKFRKQWMKKVWNQPTD